MACEKKILTQNISNGLLRNSKRSSRDSTLGEAPAVPGHFKAMKDVCERHGVLFVLDKVLSGMRRTGTLHAWEQEGIIPDLQTMAKGLGAGYASIAALLIEFVRNKVTKEPFPATAKVSVKIHALV
ncbi:pyridoxal phosphate-dependent transferase [Stachybotrys elegans]|uniref:Pyridoxal phosphate-dependent transferase n=1 Tax=Stachybotrys elegans TaxID=80388 RepID=A0A8K0SBV6_9HYPO|nr:pyridoxal phosphate-dependent transferase [Stachybotrys elegans]